MIPPAPRPNRVLATVTASVIAASGLAAVAPPAAAAAGFTLTRLEGVDRFATAARIAGDAFGSAHTVVLASGEAGHYADALAGNHLAGRLGAPILLTGKDALPGATAEALRELGAQDVIILGGDGAVGPGVEAALDAVYDVRRVAGADRYSTAQRIATDPASADVGVLSGRGRTAVLARGGDFADALVAGPISWARGFPVLITETGSLTPATRAALEELRIDNVLITGGAGAVSDAAAQQVTALGVTVTRLQGSTRTETAVAIADFAIEELGFTDEQIDLTRSDDFADALAGGPSAGARQTPIITTAGPDALGAAASGFLERRKASLVSGRILGGAAAVSPAVARSATAAASASTTGTPVQSPTGPALEQPQLGEPAAGSAEDPSAAAPSVEAPSTTQDPAAPLAPAPAPAPAPGSATVPAAEAPQAQEPAPTDEVPAASQEPIADQAAATTADLALTAGTSSGTQYVTRNEPATFSTDSTTVADDEVLVSWSISYGGAVPSRSGNGAPPVSLNHTFSVSGPQTATLQIRDSAGTTSESTVSFTVVDAPTARLTSNPSPATGEVEDGGLAVVFDGSGSTPATGSIQSWSMSYGDGQYAASRLSSGTGAPPRTLQHTYTEPGTYRATLQVTDASGASGSTTLTVTAYKATPTADVWGGRMVWLDNTYTGPFATAGESTEIRTDMSVPGQGNTWTSWTVDFGDGTAVVRGTGSPTALLRHTFASPGSRAVTLTATDSSGASSSDTVRLTVVAAPAVELVAETSPAVGSFRDGGVAVTFAARAVPGTPDVGIQQWNVQYGDCCDSYDYGWGELPATLRHTYTQPGTYEVRLDVTDETGASGSVTTTVVVHDTDAQAVVQGGRYGDAAALGTAGQPVSFRGDQSTPGHGAELAGWSLDFGDETTAASGTGTPPSSVLHTYSAAGAYDVVLTVRDSSGSTSTATLPLTVTEPPVAVLTEATRTGTIGDVGVAVTLDPTSSAAGTGRTVQQWTLQITDYSYGIRHLHGEGAPADTVQHIFTQEGSFPAVLHITDDIGATSTSELTVDVFDLEATAVLNGGRMVGGEAHYASAGEHVFFWADGSRAAHGEHLTTWSLSFGDGSRGLTGSGQALGAYSYATHVYPGAGTYPVTLTVTDSAGNSATDSLTLTVLPPPTASLVHTTVEQDADTVTISFDGSGSASNQLKITGWTLYYDDGRVDSGEGAPGQDMRHSYDRIDRPYTARLSVTDEAGGTSWTEVQIDTSSPAEVDAPTS